MESVDPKATVQRFGCSGSFAYAFVDVPTTSRAIPGVGQTDLFKASGAIWVSVRPAEYCPDHAVPAVIYQDACETY